MTTETAVMRGTMGDFPLSIQHIFWRVERLFGPKQIVTKQEDGVHRYTYAEMAARVHRLAHALDALGVSPGDRVATLSWNTYRHMETYLAVPCMGAVLHTLNLRLPRPQLEFIIADADDKVIVVDQSLLPLLMGLGAALDGVAHIVVMADDGPLPFHDLGALLDYEVLLAAAPPTRFTWPTIDENQGAAMCYTSGTTGDPKGVVYSHRSQFLHSMVGLQVDAVGLSEHDVVLPLTPMFHANSWGLPYACAMAGAALVLPGRWSGDSAAMLALAADEDVTILAGVPTLWINLLATMRAAGARLPLVRTVLCGGSAVPAALMAGMDELDLPILHAWGMTETSPVATTGRARSWHEGDEVFARRVSQGAVVPGVEIRIADLATGEELPWDGVAFGEIQVRGPWVANGYYHNAAPNCTVAGGWFRTGDVATINTEGYVSIVDRTKDVIKSGGEWISSVDLENAIMAHPAVHEAAVVGLPHAVWSERPVAYVVAKPDARAMLTAADIRDFLRDKVERWQLPDEVHFIDDVPKTSVGKFDKKALRAGAAPLDPSLVSAPETAPAARG